MSMNAWRTAVLVTAVAASIAIILSTVAAGRFTWGPPEMPKAQCEALDAATLPPLVKDALGRAYQARVATAIIREPQNTWSNLAFVFAGALIGARDRRTFPRLLGAALIALGFGSGLYHASLVPLWRHVDVATMGWVSFALACVGGAALSQRLAGLSPGRQLLMGGIGGTLAILAAVFRNDVRILGVKPFDSTYTTIAGVAVVFVLLTVGLLVAGRRRVGMRTLVIQLGLLALLVAVAAFLQINDRPGRLLCAPGNVVQAHAVWHVLMAAAITVAYDAFARIAGWATLWR